MARAQESFSKKENEKKRLKKQQEKAERRDERQANKKDSTLEEMFAYVDENGNITSTPPDPTKKKKEINVEDIVIGVPKQEDREPEDVIRTGTVTFFNASKGYGFIKDAQTQESIFVHANSLGGITIKENDKVTFEVEMGPKGPSAFAVKKATE